MNDDTGLLTGMLIGAIIGIILMALLDNLYIIPLRKQEIMDVLAESKRCEYRVLDKNKDKAVLVWCDTGEPVGIYRRKDDGTANE